MFRKLLVPLAATALLAGCVTSAPYGYRGNGQGDYYYGSPSVEYRYHDMYPGYGSPYYGPYRPGLSVWGSFGYGGYGYYGRPYYGNPYYGGYYGYPYYGGYPRTTHRPRPDNNNGGSRPDGGPWRNIDEIARRRRVVDGTGGGATPTPVMPQPQFTPAPRPTPRMGDDGGGSAMGQMIRRGRKASQQDE
jgi:hypothetical protein